MDWPSLDLPDGSRCRWYFQRMRNKEAVEAPRTTIPSRYFRSFATCSARSGRVGKRCETNLVRDSTFISGLRRGTAMYIEDRYVNLIWGLEAVHRKKGGGSDAVAAKVNRILDKIDDANGKRWLAKRLERAHEPPLEQR